ncbi:MAG: hypothetical protein FWC23_05300 [Chitinispirillia bacterium]|nr:hypothetical protein [Chitinispirillia bacterium]MCL2268585.1 hypothetical protein [Chitinispirillia bacterium]
MRKFFRKLGSRKLWVTIAGIITGVAAGEPVLSTVVSAAYVVAQGIVDASGKGGEGAGDAVQE